MWEKGEGHDLRTNEFAPQTCERLALTVKDTRTWL